MNPPTTKRNLLGPAHRLLGTRSDWRLVKPSEPRLGRLGLAVVGPVAIASSVAVSWLAFSGAQGKDGPVAFGLFIGAISVLLMAWSFVLAMRPRPLERFFGGLDSMYRAHRWAGTLAVIAMFLHTRAEPEIEGGIRGASRSLANQAEGLAGTGETILYVLVGISLIRWFPYRFWRLTHKLLGVPFAFACLHFFTAEKPYANGSRWGWWFGAWMVAGLAAWVWRVVVRDIVLRGHRYEVASVDKTETTMTIELAPRGRPLVHRAGQFAFVKVQARGMSEPHAFTIASSPANPNLRFVIRRLGDWTRRLRELELVGTEVIVEGPYGEFEPLADHGAPVWIAGGVGITPFLAALDGLQPVEDPDARPHLFYAVRSRGDASAIATLEDAVAHGRLTLTVCASDVGERLTPERFSDAFPHGLQCVHVAMCGPGGLVSSMASEARRLGASDVETEDFDIRQGFGPDLSDDIDRAVASVVASRVRPAQIP
jgi:predicted ferric reductase